MENVFNEGKKAFSVWDKTLWEKMKIFWRKQAKIFKEICGNPEATTKL